MMSQIDKNRFFSMATAYDKMVGYLLPRYDFLQDEMIRLIFADGKANKFWEIAQNGVEVTTRWGRIGANGQTKTKSFDSEEKAQAEVNKQMGLYYLDKVRKNFSELLDQGK